MQLHLAMLVIMIVTGTPWHQSEFFKVRALGDTVGNSSDADDVNKHSKNNGQ